MININATINGEDFKEVYIPEVNYSYKYLTEVLKDQFTVSNDNEIEVFDENHEEISNMQMDSN
jgi:hypothetical protein